jgi:DNA-binding IclR family transcriptional regulator
VNFSYPIFDERGSALGALTIPYIQHFETNVTADKVRNALREAVREITAAIGGRMPRA